MSTDRAVHVVAAAHRHPERELDNDTIARLVPGLTSEWSVKYLGMETRRVLGVGERAVDLTIAAVHDAVGAVSWDPTSLDVIISGGTFPDQVVPASASYVAKATSPDAVAFDVNAACASLLYALSTAHGLLTAGTMTRAAVCAGEHPTAYADYTDSHSCVFFGDSAAALLLTTEPPPSGAFRVVDILLSGDHRYPEKVFVPRGGYFRSDGRYSYGQVVRMGTAAVRTLLERNDVASGTLRAAVFHQANMRLLHDLGDALHIPVGRIWHNLEWAGNQSAAGVGTAFSAGWAEHRDEFRAGDHVVLASVGGGYTGGAVLLRWEEG